jgi:hypothetical protein
VAWVLEGHLLAEEVPYHFIPLSSDRLLVSGWSKPLVLNGQASALGVFKRSSGGDFILEKLVQPFSQSWFQKVGEPGAGVGSNEPGLFTLRKEYRAFTFHALRFARAAFRTLPEGAAFVSLWTGQVWVFDAKGDIRRSYQVFESPKESDWPRLLMFEPALLGVFPSSSGTLLLASRSREAVLEGRKKHPVFSTDQEGKLILPQGGASSSVENQMNMGFLYPEILWWELDPEKGGLHRLEAPPGGAPTQLPMPPELAQAWIQAFHPEMERDGTVRVKSTHATETPSRPTPRSEEPHR